MRGGLGKAPVCNVSSMEDAVRTGAIYTRAAMYVDGEQLLALIQLSTCQFEVWRCLASTLTSALKPRLYVCDAFRPLTCKARTTASTNKERKCCCRPCKCVPLHMFTLASVRVDSRVCCQCESCTCQQAPPLCTIRRICWPASGVQLFSVLWERRQQRCWCRCWWRHVHAQCELCCCCDERCPDWLRGDLVSYEEQQCHLQ